MLKRSSIDYRSPRSHRFVSTRDRPGRVRNSHSRPGVTFCLSLPGRSGRRCGWVRAVPGEQVVGQQG